MVEDARGPIVITDKDLLAVIEQRNPDEIDSLRSAIAVREVAATYLSDQRTRARRGEYRQNTAAWEHVAMSNPIHGEMILDLGQAIERVETLSYEPRPREIGWVGRPFTFVDDSHARRLLRTVLTSRTLPQSILPTNYFSMYEEANAMAAEMGIQGWHLAEAKGLRLEGIIEPILQGSLRLHPAPLEQTNQ